MAPEGDVSPVAATGGSSIKNGDDSSPGADDHDVTAALFDSLGTATTADDQQAIRSSVSAEIAFGGREHDAMEVNEVSEPIHWSEVALRSAERVPSINENDLENMFMALDEASREVRGDPPAQADTMAIDQTATPRPDGPGELRTSSEGLAAERPGEAEDQDMTPELFDSLAGDVAAACPASSRMETPSAARDTMQSGGVSIDDKTVSNPHDTASAQLSAAGESQSSPPSKQQESRLCAVCHKEPGKYKCPQCTAPFCSIACNRVHKENHPALPEKPPTETIASRPLKRAREDEDPYKVLLDHQAELQRLFQKHPGLMDELNRIGKATFPPAQNDTGKGGLPFKHKNPRGNPQKQRPWTQEDGLRRGAAVLRKARTDPGDKGDAVREYCELVLYLLSKPSGTKMSRVVRDEIKAGDAKAVEELMQMENEEED